MVVRLEGGVSEDHHLSPAHGRRCARRDDLPDRHPAIVCFDHPRPATSYIEDEGGSIMLPENSIL